MVCIRVTFWSSFVDHCFWNHYCLPICGICPPKLHYWQIFLSQFITFIENPKQRYIISMFMIIMCRGSSAACWMHDEECGPFFLLKLEINERKKRKKRCSDRGFFGHCSSESTRHTLTRAVWLFGSLSIAREGKGRAAKQESQFRGSKQELPGVLWGGGGRWTGVRTLRNPPRKLTPLAQNFIARQRNPTSRRKSLVFS